MIHIPSADAMQDFGERIGRLLKGGEVFELIGDVGAGKTTFVHGLARGFGVSEQIQSPSFTINRVYDAPGGKSLAHYDFYRLDDPGIMADELSEVLQDTQAVVVIEWADAVAAILPDDRLTLRIAAVDEQSREITVEAHGNKSQQLVKELHDYTA